MMTGRHPSKTIATRFIAAMVAMACSLVQMACVAERKCGFFIGCESQVRVIKRYRAIVDDVPPWVLSAAACKWKGDELIAKSRTCDGARLALEDLVQRDPDCAMYRDAGPPMVCR